MEERERERRSPEELRALAAILERPLSDETAWERRQKALKDEPRDPEKFLEPLGELDELVALLHQRLAEALEREAEREEVVDLELEDADVVEIPAEDAVPAVPGAPPELRRATPPPLAAADAELAQRLHAEAQKATTLLYEDVIWLLSINDGEGALISLERLLVTSEMAGEIKEFVELNQPKLLNLYEGYIGPFKKVPSRTHPTELKGMPEAYSKSTKIAHILGLVDGTRSLADIIDASGYDALEACCILNQLRRSELIRV